MASGSKEIVPSKKKSSSFKHFLAGGCGGISLVFAGHPLDTIKVRLQTQPTPKPGQAAVFNGMFDCARKTISKEGVRGLYKGMGTPLLVATPMCAVGFMGYGLGKSLQIGKNTTRLSNFQTFKAGMLSGLFISFLNTPGERIKCLLQIQRGADPTKAKYLGPLDCARQVYRAQGLFRGLYKGMGFTLLRDVPASGTYFATYEFFLRHLAAGSEDHKLSPMKIVIAGGSAGIFANLISLPSDVLKSRYQTAPDGTYKKGMIDVISRTISKEGPSVFFKGATPLMTRAFPANAACFLGFEVSLKALDWVL